VDDSRHREHDSASSGRPIATVSSATAYHVFCDESYTSGGSTNRFRIQAGIWVRDTTLPPLRTELSNLRAKYPRNGEVKWNKLRGSRMPRIVSGLIDVFFSSSVAAQLRFACLAVRESDDPTAGQAAATRDLGQFKAYHLLLSHRLEAGTAAHLVLDGRPNIRPGAEAELQSCLNASGRRRDPPFAVLSCRSVDSAQEDMIQLVDVLGGAVGWAWNDRPSRAGAKRDVHDAICKALGWRTLARETGPWERKFGVWPYRPRVAAPGIAARGYSNLG